LQFWRIHAIKPCNLLQRIIIEIPNSMLYQLYEMNHALIAPMRAAVIANRFSLDPQWNPYANSYPGKVAGAAFELFDRATKHYAKPVFGIDTIDVLGVSVPVTEEVVESLPFCDLRHFKRDFSRTEEPRVADPTVLLVAPMSGHNATLLCGTMCGLLPNHDVYITDWQDAREVAMAAGRFDLDDYIDYVINFIQRLGDDVHVIAVCQPGPAVVAATALMSEASDPCVPSSVTLTDSPIDTRMSPTEPNEFAVSKSLEWFERHVIMRVPFPSPGCMRRVYPGFLQLTGFMTMHFGRHLSTHQKLFSDLIAGDREAAAAHREFYDEYLSVMDLTAEYYLQTIDVVFQRHALPEGQMRHRDRKVDTTAISTTGLLTVEGELDDISGIGRTQAAHALFCNVPQSRKLDYVQEGAGHYGVFNGSRWHDEIAPCISEFIRSNRS
jgi:poly(3-hydroxybutyrate) depolymerase